MNWQNYDFKKDIDCWKEPQQVPGINIESYILARFPNALEF